MCRHVVVIENFLHLFVCLLFVFSANPVIAYCYCMEGIVALTVLKVLVEVEMSLTNRIVLNNSSICLHKKDKLLPALKI